MLEKRMVAAVVSWFWLSPIASLNRCTIIADPNAQWRTEQYWWMYGRVTDLWIGGYHERAAGEWRIRTSVGRRCMSNHVEIFGKRKEADAELVSTGDGEHRSAHIERPSPSTPTFSDDSYDFMRFIRFHEILTIRYTMILKFLLRRLIDVCVYDCRLIPNSIHQAHDFASSVSWLANPLGCNYCHN